MVAYPDGHGRGNLLIRRSEDAGKTWQPVAIPVQRVEETPILYRLDLPNNRERVLLVTMPSQQKYLGVDVGVTIKAQHGPLVSNGNGLAPAGLSSH